MKRLLLETGVGKSVECGYCGYPGAEQETETRFDLIPTTGTTLSGGYGVHEYCDLCGFEEYGEYKFSESQLLRDMFWGCLQQEFYKYY